MTSAGLNIIDTIQITGKRMVSAQATAMIRSDYGSERDIFAHDIHS